MDVNTIRTKFVDFFKSKNHKHLPSSGLIPEDDPSLLFTNSGMVQFKKTFLGQTKPIHKEVTTIQRCLRAGGKHNDLESVGLTSRHHTYFEMLGNFSFGGYFKREAINYAYECLTSVFKIPTDRLIVTISNEDIEAEKIWLNEIKINPLKLIKLDGDENFWQMGSTGPCGPCSELFYDYGKEVEGGPPGSPTSHLDRFTEIWNIVFMQYFMAENGEKKPLAKPSIDTGMGLERLSAVLQGKTNNFETKQFQILIKNISEILHLSSINTEQLTALRVIADHLRASVFMINDGITPLNEGRGYVLRRIIRRALRFANSLQDKNNQPFLHELVAGVLEQSDLEITATKTKDIAAHLLREEELFSHTLLSGVKHYTKAVEGYKANTTQSILPGHVIFKLYDTYGFPIDLIKDMSRERGIALDMKGYDVCMQAQKERGKKQKFQVPHIKELESLSPTSFVGYDNLQFEGSTVLSIIRDQQITQSLKDEQSAIIILDTTPFYAESGGQAGDTGTITSKEGIFNVFDTTKLGDYYLHHGVFHCYRDSQPLQIGTKVSTQIDIKKRANITANHSATHLLHKALRECLGNTATQRGSLVTDSYVRFDFSYGKKVSDEDIQRIEESVNHEIARASDTQIQYTTMDNAINQGAIALFGERYDAEKVRLLKIGSSIELCGGTHVQNTAQIGAFAIVEETAVAAGIRRVMGITAPEIKKRYSRQKEQLAKLSKKLNCNPEEIFEKCQQVIEKNKIQQEEIEAMTKNNLESYASSLISDSQPIRDIRLIVKQASHLDKKNLKPFAESIVAKSKDLIVCLGIKTEENQSLMVFSVSSPISNRFSMKELTEHLSPIIGNRGGGRSELMQIVIEGDIVKSKLLEACQSKIESWIKNKTL